MEEASTAAGAAVSTTGAGAGVRVTSLTGAAAFLEDLALAGAVAGAGVVTGAGVVVLDALTILACIYYISVIYLSKFPVIYINCHFNYYLHTIYRFK